MSKITVADLAKRMEVSEKKLIELEEENGQLKDRISKLENRPDAIDDAPKKEPKKAPKKKAEKAAGGAGHYMIATFKKEIKDQVKIELAKIEFDISDDDEKMSKKIYDTYKEFVNNNTFGSMEEACKAFPEFWTNLQAKAKAKAEAAEAKKMAKKVDEDAPAETDEIEILTIDELKKLKLKPNTEKVGVFWDEDNVCHVTGPLANKDEDTTEVTFQGKTYNIGDDTFRVYSEFGAAANREAYFLGFAGIGPFAKMKISVE